MDDGAPPPVASPGRWPTVVAAVVTVVIVVAVGTMLLRGRPIEVVYDRWMLHVAPIGVFAAWLARALVRRDAGHWLGRPLLALAAVTALHLSATSLADVQMLAAGIDDVAGHPYVPAELPLRAAIPAWFSAWLWLPAPALLLPFMLLRFPDGELPGPRWGSVLPTALAGLGLLVASHAVAAWPWSTVEIRTDRIPLATPMTFAALVAGCVLVLAALVAALASLVARWRTATGEQRRQIRAVSTPAALLLLVTTVLWPWPTAWAAAQFVAVVWLVTAYVLALLRYRLHDLDVAINRTVAGSVLAALVTGSYLAIVVGIGGLVGRNAEHPLLPLLAAGLVAVLFEPARRRVRRVVDRLLYGRDADAYQVLSELAAQLRHAGSIDTVTAHVTDLLVRSTGATAAQVTMERADGRHVLASSGPASVAPPVLTADVTHDGERLGEVTLHARSSSDLAPDASDLLTDVAGTLGAVLRNAVLTAALQAQVDELRRSRQRLVTAQDVARRELERDLHDGAQSTLIALRLQLGLAASQAAALQAATAPLDLATVQATIDRCGSELDAAIRSLRDLSRGLQPPALTTEGIAAALRAGVRGLPVDVVIEADGLGRYPPPVEAAVYFSCLEAVKNAATHAAARVVRIELTETGGRLHLVVEDDGHGFDPQHVGPGRGLANLHDRIAGLDGDLTIDAAPGRGTRIVGVLPVQPLVSDR